MRVQDFGRVEKPTSTPGARKSKQLLLRPSRGAVLHPKYDSRVQNFQKPRFSEGFIGFYMDGDGWRWMPSIGLKSR